MHKVTKAAMAALAIIIGLAGISYLADNANPPAAIATGAQAKPVPMTPQQIQAAQAANRQAAANAEALATRSKESAKLVRALQQDGFLRTVDGRGDFATVVVGPNFPLATYEQKSQLAQLVSVYVTGGDNTRCATLVLLEPMNHKRIGRFAGCSLEMM